jgi:hypothetical protein
MVSIFMLWPQERLNAANIAMVGCAAYFVAQQNPIIQPRRAAPA